MKYCGKHVGAVLHSKEEGVTPISEAPQKRMRQKENRTLTTYMSQLWYNTGCLFMASYNIIKCRGR